MEYKKIFLSLILLHTILFIGITGYMVMENLSFFEAIWLTIVSVMTIGYGDLVPQTTGGRWLTVIIIPLAVGLATYMLAQFAGAIISGRLSNEMRKRKMTRNVQHLNDHIILCGYGRVGKQVYLQLQKEDKSVVVIDKDEMVLEKISDSALHVHGNATEDEVLLRAGIERAKGVIITLPDDADNVFITLTVKGLNAEVHTVARAEKDYSEEKLYRAGADYVINTSNIGGNQMATAISKPKSVEYIENILHGFNSKERIEELLIDPESPLIDYSVEEMKNEFGVNTFAIKRREEVISNPPLKEKVENGDLLIVFATSEQFHNLQDKAHTTKK